MIKYYCDGCERKLEGEELIGAQIIASQAARSEFFCRRCVERASEYWKESIPVIQRANEQRDATVVNHRRTFFKQPWPPPKEEGDDIQ